MSRTERVLAEMEEARLDAEEFMKLAERYEEAGDSRGSEIAWLAHKLALRQYHDASIFYKKITVMSGDSITA